MNEGDTKPFEEMTRDELLAAATFWRSEYERVIAGGAGFTIYPKCGLCGCSHHPGINCHPIAGGGYWYTQTFGGW